MVSPEPRLQFYCAWSLNQNIESELLRRVYSIVPDIVRFVANFAAYQLLCL